MEAMVPLHDLSSATSSPYISAPSSPKRFGDPFDYYYHYTSTPTSPTHITAILAADRYSWEDNSMATKSPHKSAGGGSNSNDFDDFAFEFSGQLEKGGQPSDLTTADELFEEGKIRPLNKTSIPSTPRSRHGVEATRERGRERGPTASSIPSSRSRKGSRSLSPMRSRVGSFLQKAANSTTTASTTATPVRSTVASECLKASNGSRKWRLRDLLLFRSASEGRATGNKSKDPLRKFTIASSSPIVSTKSGGVDSGNSSFRSAADSVGGSQRRAKVSAHEMHYVSNRAASEEMKRKTALPFNRQGLFGCLRFNPAVNSIAKSFAQ